MVQGSLSIRGRVFQSPPLQWPPPRGRGRPARCNPLTDCAWRALSRLSRLPRLPGSHGAVVPVASPVRGRLGRICSGLPSGSAAPAIQSRHRKTPKAPPGAVLVGILHPLRALRRLLLSRSPMFLPYEEEPSNEPLSDWRIRNIRRFCGHGSRRILGGAATSPRGRRRCHPGRGGWLFCRFVRTTIHPFDNLLPILSGSQRILHTPEHDSCPLPSFRPLCLPFPAFSFPLLFPPEHLFDSLHPTLMYAHSRSNPPPPP